MFTPAGTTRRAAATQARIRGHGLAVTPEAPFVARRAAEGSDDVVVEHAGRRTTVTGGPDGWRIDFGEHTITWPEHFALTSATRDHEPFELWDADGAGIFVHGPLPQRPAEHELVLAGQTVTASGVRGTTPWVELTYVHAGADWTQRHLLLPTGHVLTCQALTGKLDDVLATAERICDEMLGG